MSRPLRERSEIRNLKSEEQHPCRGWTEWCARSGDCISDCGLRIASLGFSSRGGKGRAMTISVSPRRAGTLNPTRQQLEELDALLQRMLELPVQPLDKPEQAKGEEPAEEPPPLPRPVPMRQREEQTPPPLQPATPPISYSTVSYTVVETAFPRPLPPASGFEPRPPMPASRLMPTAPPEPPPEPPPAPPVPEASEAETWIPLRSTWQPSASTWPPLAESWHQANNRKSSLPVPGPVSDPQPEPPPPPEPVSTVEIPAPLPRDETSLRAEDSELGTPAVPWPLLPLLWFNQGFDACLAPLGAPGHWLCGRGRWLFGFIGLACLAAAVALAVNSGMGWSW